MSEPPLVFDRVSMRFRQRAVLRDVSFVVESGTCVALLGPNGAGKTTSLSVALGLRRPTGGRVRLYGIDPRRPVARRRVGCVSQGAQLPEDLRVGEVLGIVSRMYGRSACSPRALELLGSLALTTKCGALSGGWAGVVKLACALSADPELLVLDEPGAALDSHKRQLMWRTLDAFVADGGSVLISTHDIDEAEHLARHVVVLRGGEVHSVVHPTELDDLLRLTEVRFVCHEPAAITSVLDVRADHWEASPDGEVRAVCKAPAPLLGALLSRVDQLDHLSVRRLSLSQVYEETLAAPRQLEVR